MNLDLEIMKELYIEEIEKLKKLPFYQYLQKERKRDIQRDIFAAITSNNDNDIFKEVEVYLEGGLLQDIREKLGNQIVEDITDLLGELKKNERNKNAELVQNEREKIRDKEYPEAIKYLCCMLIIKRLRDKLLELEVIPEIDVEGRIKFRHKI